MQVRLRALCDRRLQSVLDAVVLEPADWLQGERKAPTTVPDRTRAHLKTPVGILFNELMFSPAGWYWCHLVDMNVENRK